MTPSRTVHCIRGASLFVPLSSQPPHQSFSSRSLARFIRCRRHIASTMVNGESFYRRRLPAGLIEFSSEEGKSRFESALSAGTADAFFPLVSQYQTQSHPALCGLTTLTIMLNALQIDPGRVWMDPWRWFAESLLDCCLDLQTARTQGVTMDELARTARCNGADVNVLRDVSVDEARTLLLRCVRRQSRGEEEFAAVAFSRFSLAQTGDGHYSPVAAIDEASNSALILDTARFKTLMVSTSYEISLIFP